MRPIPEMARLTFGFPLRRMKLLKLEKCPGCIGRIAYDALLNRESLFQKTELTSIILSGSLIETCNIGFKIIRQVKENAPSNRRIASESGWRVSGFAHGPKAREGRIVVGQEPKPYRIASLALDQNFDQFAESLF